MGKESYQKVSDIIMEAELLTEGLDMGTANRIIGKLREFEGLTPRQLLPKVNKMRVVIRSAVPAFRKLPKLQKTYELRFRTFIKKEFNMTMSAFENSRLRIAQLLKERGLLPKKHAYNYSRFFTVWICHRIRKMNPEAPLGPANITKEAKIEIRTMARMVMASKSTSEEEIITGIVKKLPPKRTIQLIITMAIWMCLTFILIVLGPKISLSSQATIGYGVIFLLISTFIVLYMLDDMINSIEETMYGKKKPKEKKPEEQPKG